MNYYEIWCDLKDSKKDMEFAQAVNAYLTRLQSMGRIVEFRVTRRKLGFGPPTIGEFNITIGVDDLAQLDSAFDVAARRSGEIEALHAAVYSKVTGFQAALYRDFPDPQRETTIPK